MKVLSKYVALSILMFVFCGCASYTFGVKRLLESSGNRTLSLFAGITPKERLGVGIPGKAVFEIVVIDYNTGKRLLRYKRNIRVANCTYETKLEGKRLSVEMTDRFDSSRKWTVGFAETSNGHFVLEYEDGKFE